MQFVYLKKKEYRTLRKFNINSFLLIIYLRTHSFVGMVCFLCIFGCVGITSLFLFISHFLFYSKLPIKKTLPSQQVGMIISFVNDNLHGLFPVACLIRRYFATRSFKIRSFLLNYWRWNRQTDSSCVSFFCQLFFWFFVLILFDFSSYHCHSYRFLCLVLALVITHT